MANFRTHIASGIVLGSAAVAGAVRFSLADDMAFMTALFAGCAVGAIMPDMDSDSSVPFHVTFGSLSVVAGLVAFNYAMTHEAGNVAYVVGSPLLAAAFVWIVVGAIFKKFTHHHGMAHSVPAALLAGLAVFSATRSLGRTDWQAFLLGTGLSAGYLLHLILDEAHAVFHPDGIPGLPKKSFGTALKLRSHDIGVTLAVWSATLFLLLGNFKELSAFVTQLRDKL